MKTIADRLKHARAFKNLTQTKLASMAGVCTATIGNIEIGLREAQGNLPKIADALDVSHKWLAYGQGDMLDTITPYDFLPPAQRPSSWAATYEEELVQILETHDNEAERRRRVKLAKIAYKQMDRRVELPKIDPAVPSGGTMDTLERAIEFLAKYLERLEPSDRRRAMRELGDLAQQPHDHAKITARIEAIAPNASARGGKYTA